MTSGLGFFPLGTPDTWCHRMVICTKKNGSLRRTIDFQHSWLDVCAHNGITLNPGKFRFAQDEVGLKSLNQRSSPTANTSKTSQLQRASQTSVPGSALSTRSHTHSQWRRDVPVQGTAEAILLVQVDRRLTTVVRCFQNRDLRPHQGRRADLRESPPNLPGNGLEQGRDRVLAITEALPVPVPRDLLLPGGLESHTCGLSLHAPG